MIATSDRPTISLEAFLENPIDHIEWIDGHLVENSEMTAKTGRIQARLAYYWRNHLIATAQGGEVYTETSCRTVGRVRCPDVAYLPPHQVEQFGDFKVLPQSFPLVAEVVSPTDQAEAVFTKVREYLDSSCQEIWLIFPDSQWLMIITTQSQQLLSLQDTATTQQTLPGFSVAIADLIA